MPDIRICISSPGWRSRPSFSFLLLAVLGCCGFVISGCIAQQADLSRLKSDLNDQIVQIKKEKKELQDEVARAREAIAEGEKQTAALKAENKKLFRSRAEINQQFREFREKDLAEMNGEIEKVNKNIEDLQLGLKAENIQIEARIQEVETQTQAQEEDLTAHGAKTAALIQQVDQDGISYNQKMTEFQVALTAFKESLADLGNKFVQEAERDSRVETELSQQMGQSVTTIKEAIGQSGMLLGSRVDEEAARVALLESKQSQLEKDIFTVTEKLNGDLVGLETQLVTQSNQIQELSQTALQLKEHQGVMGSLLGQRGDDLIQQAGRLDERMKLLESHQTSLDQTMETNRQNTTRHLDALTASLISMNQALQKTTGDFAAQLTTQEQALNDLTQQIQALQAIKGEVETNQSQITDRLVELENHQSAVTTKVDSDVQTINTHLKEVNSAIASEKEALAQVHTQLNTRIDKQEQHLNKALTSFQSVQAVKKTSQNNRAHLNQLTETVNKLRDVLTTIGKKFGERVDQHEARIAELAKRINQLLPKKVKK